MRYAVIALVAALAAPAFAQTVTPFPTAPPAVTLEQKPEIFDNSPLIVCRRPDAPQADQQSDKRADKESIERCRLAPPKKERHPDYGKGKFYELTPA